MTSQTDVTTEPVKAKPATDPVTNGMRPVAMIFAAANAAVVVVFLALVALGHVETGLPGIDLGLTATAAPSGR